MNHTLKEIANAARRLHWNYGAGDVLTVNVFFDGRIELWAKRTSCTPKKYIGRICANGKSVRMHNHQCKIGFEQQS